MGSMKSAFMKSHILKGMVHEFWRANRKTIYAILFLDYSIENVNKDILYSLWTSLRWYVKLTDTFFCLP